MRRGLALCGIGLAAFLVYANTLGHGFVWDDRALIVEERSLGDWSRLWENMSGEFFQKSEDETVAGYWRPLVTLSFMCDRALHGDRPGGFHLFNVLAHVVASCLVLLVAERLPLPREAPFGAALLFAVHPVHVESVAWIAGRTDLLCAIFFLLALLADLENARAPRAWKQILVAASTALALFAKEIAVVLPAVIALRALLLPGAKESARGPRRAAASAAWPAAAAVALYVLARLVLLGTPLPAQPPAAGRLELFRTWWSAVLEYARVLIWPARLAVDVEVPLERSFLSGRVVGGMIVVALVVLIAWRARRRAPALAFALGLLLFALAPLSNVLLPILAPGTEIPFPWAERFLYIPSVGFCIAAAWAALAARPRAAQWRVGVASLLVLLAAAAAYRTAARAKEWTNELTLFGAAVRAFPERVTTHLNLAIALEEAGRRADAWSEYQRALTLDPLSSAVHYNLGNFHLAGSDLTRAEGAYREALRLRPGYAQAHLNLGVALLLSNRTAEALVELTAACAARENYLDAEVNRAYALRLLGRADEAIPLYEKALAAAPDLPAATLGLAAACLEAGAQRRGEQLLRELLAREPDHAEARRLLEAHVERTEDSSTGP